MSTKETLKEMGKEAGKAALKEGGNALIDAGTLQLYAKKDKQRDDRFVTLEKTYQAQAQKDYQALQVDRRLQKAYLIPRTGEGASKIEFMFNPTDLSFSRNVSITMMNGARTVRGLPKVNFGFVEPYKLTLSGILFDTYETNENVFDKIQPLLDAVSFDKFKDPFQVQRGAGVEYQERKLKAGGSEEVAIRSLSAGAKTISPSLSKVFETEYGTKDIAKQALEIRRPPVFYFIWGEKNYMCCMIQQLDYKLTMFLPNGTPVRAMVTITLQEVDLGVASRSYSAREG